MPEPETPTATSMAPAPPSSAAPVRIAIAPVDSTPAPVCIVTLPLRKFLAEANKTDPLPPSRDRAPPLPFLLLPAAIFTSPAIAPDPARRLTPAPARTENAPDCSALVPVTTETPAADFNAKPDWPASTPTAPAAICTLELLPSSELSPVSSEMLPDESDEAPVANTRSPEAPAVVVPVEILTDPLSLASAEPMTTLPDASEVPDIKCKSPPTARPVDVPA